MRTILKAIGIVCLLTTSGLPTSVVAQTISATFSTSQSIGCSPLVVNFSNTSTGAQSYFWDFGNGNTSTLANPVNIYTTSGDYTVSLIAFSNGQSDTLIQPYLIHVEATPTTSFTYSGSTCTNDSISFLNTTTGASAYLWDFGDGTMSSQTQPKHAYPTSGNYQVTVLATSASGCSQVASLSAPLQVHTAPNPQISVDTTASCFPNHIFQIEAQDTSITNWQWQVANTPITGNQLINHNFGVPGQHQIHLTASNAFGCSRSDSLTVDVYPSFQPTVSFSDSVGCVPFTTSFSHQNVASAWFDFGDGTTSNLPEPSKSYSTSGSYSVSLLLTDSNQCQFADTINTVFQAIPSPVANFGLSAGSGCSPLNVQFTDSSLNANSWSWNFGGTSVATTQNSSHVFTNAGAHTVTLVVESSNGCRDSLQQSNAVTVQSIQADFSTALDTGCAPFTANINSNVNASTYWWNLGNGQNSNLKHLSANYSQNGFYDVTLAVTSSMGCTDTLTKSQFIRLASPVLNFTTPSDAILCKPGSVKFDATMVGNGPWVWDFGDGDSALISDPLHSFQTPGNYQVKLHTISAQGCSIELPFQTVIVSEQIASVNHSTIPCPNLTGVFSNQSQGAIAQHWEFGDGDTSSQASPVHIYANGGVYTGKLTTWDSLNCSDEATIFPINFPPCSPSTSPPSSGTVTPPLVSTYVPQPLTGCSPYQMQFSNPVDTALSHLWYFGDGDSSNLASPGHSYTQSGTFDVMLCHRNSVGVWDTIFWPQLIHVTTPVSKFGWSQSLTCTGGLLSFSDSSSQINSYAWDFGDGQTDTVAQPSHFYSTGNYQILLTVQDSLGCTATSSEHLTVGIPNPSFYYSPSLCLGDTLAIQHNLLGYSSFQWDMGDGNYSIDAFPSYTYSAAGTYSIEVTAWDSNGCSSLFPMPISVTVYDPQPDFSFNSPTVGCDSIVVSLQNLSTQASSFQWILGNGDTSTTTHPTVNYSTPGSYSITLIANQQGCSNAITYIDTVTIHQAQAAFSYSQNQDCLPISTQFTSLSSGVVSNVWDFGDSTQSTQNNPLHLYTQLPDYSPCLMIVDSNGCHDTLQVTPINVHQSKAAISVTSGCQPLSVSFTDSSSNAQAHWWNFGDTSFSTLANPVHLYTDSGLFQVQLATQASSGCWDTLNISTPIHAMGIDAQFTASFTPGCAPVNVDFQSNYPANTSFFWDFGNGTTSTLANPQYLYTIPGNYDITLVVTSASGCIDTLVKPNLIEIHGPLLQASVSDTIGCHPLPVQFQNQSSNAQSYAWYSGDGQSYNTVQPSHTYQQPGTYTPTLVGTDSNGCSRFISLEPIQVLLAPTAQFEFQMDTTCLPALVTFSNLSSQLDSAGFHWDFGNGKQFSGMDTSVLYDQKGSYAIQLNVTNGNGCADSLFQPNLFQVFDTVALLDPKILYATVDHDSATSLLWEPSMEPNFQVYDLYRFAPLDTGFTKIASSTDRFQTLYIDHATDPLAMSYAYMVRTQGECAQNKPLHSLIASNTIELRVENDTVAPVLHWTPYGGARFDHYEIFRKDPEQDLFHSIGTASATDSLYRDISLLCPGSYSYKVKAINIHQKGHSAFSDSSDIQINVNPLAEQQVDVLRSTVVEDQLLLTEWAPPTLSPSAVTGYSIYRSSNDGPYQLLATVPASQTIFLDEKVKVHQLTYAYRIEVQNTCQSATKPGNKGQAVRLQGELNEGTVKLTWTPYEGWANGVQQYRIEQQDENGNWVPVQTVQGSQHETTLQH